MHSDVFKRAGSYISGDHEWHPDRAVINGVRMGTGLDVEGLRNHEYFASAGEFPDSLLLDEKDLKAAFELQAANESSLYHLRKRLAGLLDSLNQGHYGLCWAFSSTKAVMYIRAIMGLLIKKLSSWWVAGIVKGWRDQGGWGEASLDQIIKAGVPEYDLCPSYDKKYATPEVAENAKLHIVTEWWEGSSDKDKATHQMLTAYALGLPPVCDYNHMGHSMCGCRVASFKSLNEFEVDDDNSWGMDAGTEGLYRLANGKAKPDGLVIPRVALAA